MPLSSDALRLRIKKAILEFPFASYGMDDVEEFTSDEWANDLSDLIACKVEE